MLAQVSNFDEASARRMRPADQPCANEGDKRADGENDGDEGERVQLQYPPREGGGYKLQRFALEPAGALCIERVQFRPFEARHIGFDFVADLGLQISKVPIALRKTLEQRPIECELGRRIDWIEAVFFVNQPA